MPLTVLLALLTINAINFVDGLDGLAAGVGAIAALAFFAFSYALSVGAVTGGVAQARISSPTLIAAVLAGVCLGFLPHNFNPARVFMGDTGAMLIGLMLAASVTSLTGQVNYANLPAESSFPVLLPLLLPIAVLAVPLVDLLLAVVRRTRAGRSPFAPDKAHLHHRLLEIGHSHRRAVLILYFWTALLAFGAVTASLAEGPLPVLASMAGLAVVALLASSVPAVAGGTVPWLTAPAPPACASRRWSPWLPGESARCWAGSGRASRASCRPCWAPVSCCCSSGPGCCRSCSAAGRRSAARRSGSACCSSTTRCGSRSPSCSCAAPTGPTSSTPGSSG